MKTFVRNLIGSSVLVAFSTIATAEIAVIVNPANADALTKDDISALYLAKTKTFPGGKNAIPLDRPEGSPSRVEFVSKVIDKDEAQMKSYWSRLIFTGKGVPPKVVESDAEVKDMVARNPDTIGFIDAAAADATVKVVGKF
ncbi:MAG: phosphate ABC transporter substrate-binding protein [Gammaproteobacteria bacterium]|nr:phosphate ABC transporter substrate-binding protein [Gammaproteobacteria bacterium]